MTSEVVVGHGKDYRCLFLVALEQCDQTQEYKDNTGDETNIGGDRALCLERLDGRLFPSKVMVGYNAGCHGLLLEVVTHGPCPGARGLHQY